MALEMEVHGRRKRRWLDRVRGRGDIKEKELLVDECTTKQHGGIYRQTSTPHKIGNKMKRKNY